MITDIDMLPYGGVVVRLFRYYYPDGTTMEQMHADAPKSLWIRTVLAEMESDFNE